MKKSLLILLGSTVLVAGSLSAQTYLNENFEGGSMPAGWAAVPNTNAWAVPGVTSTYFTPPAHTVYAACNDDAVQTAANGNSMLTSPVVNLGAASSVYLKYDCFFAGLGGETADVMYSTDGGSTWSVASAITANNTAWATYTLNMSSMIGNQSNVKISFRYNDAGAWNYGVAVDNVKLFSPVANDAEMTIVTPTTGSPQSYGVISANISIGGTITNEGLSPITSMAIKYNAGSGVQTYNVSSVNIASFGTYNFTHNIPYNIPSAGAHPITVWVELSGDNNHTNDTLGTIINGAAFIPAHSVTIEEATGTWCGWCVRGIVFLDSMNAVHPNDCNLIAVHNGDPMVVTAYDAGVGTLIAGYPSILVNRDMVDDPSNIFPAYNNSIGDFGYADLVPTVTFNATTRVATVVVAAHFAVDLAGNYRLACAFTESDVHSTAGGQWDQHNYYSSQSQNIPLVDQETGFNFQTALSTIPSSQMYYGYVARTIVGGFSGQVGSLPATIPAGSTQSYTFNYTIPATYDYTKMKAIVMLIDNNVSPNHIMNSAGQSIPLGIGTPSALNGVSVYPNPFNQSTNIELNLLKSETVTVEMFDMTGKLVKSSNEGNLSEGKHLIAINGANLSEGMYFLKITAGTSVVTQKVSIAH